MSTITIPVQQVHKRANGMSLCTAEKIEKRKEE
jgi:hypothetical protein